LELVHIFVCSFLVLISLKRCYRQYYYIQTVEGWRQASKVFSKTYPPIMWTCYYDSIVSVRL
jgi:hypothetical protein